MNTRKRVLPENESERPRKRQRGQMSKNWDVRNIVAKLEKALRSKGNAADAIGMKKYMRDQFNFFGVKTPLRRKVVKEILIAEDEELSLKDIRNFAVILWRKPQREFQFIAQEFLEKHRKRLCGEKSEFGENMKLFKSLITTKSWWDTVDMLAYKLVGYTVQIHPSKGKPLMQEWICSGNMWLRRTAILHQLTCKNGTDEDLLFSFCLARCEEEEFFIRKAIGWALRDYAKSQPTKVTEFLLRNKDSLSKLSFNEAAKHLKIAKK